MWVRFKENCRQLKKRIFAWCWRHLLFLFIAHFIVLFLIVYCSPLMFFTIPSGHAGVVFNRFFGGTDTSMVRDEGFQIIAPWDRLTIYDVRIQQKQFSFQVICVNGLAVMVTTSIRFHPKIEELGYLQKNVGPNYLEAIILPDVQALVRETVGHYTPEELYTTKRSLIQQALQATIADVGNKYVVLDDLLVKSVELPPKIQAAIEAKLVEEQRSLGMKYRIEWQTQEATRQIIEAGGVNRAQTLIGQTLTEELLQYKAITAMETLAESPNAKVIITGNQRGLPFMLDPSSTGTGANSVVTPSAKIPAPSSGTSSPGNSH